MNPLEHLFPGLVGSSYQLTSSQDSEYNCIAWAAGDTENWWWPGVNLDQEYWPPGIPRSQTQEAFLAAFASLNYFVCENAELEAGYEKVALFADADGPTHAARQLTNGRWTSKLGKLEDIEHGLHDLEGNVYGKVVVIVKRQIHD